LGFLAFPWRLSYGFRLWLGDTYLYVYPEAQNQRRHIGVEQFENGNLIDKKVIPAYKASIVRESGELFLTHNYGEPVASLAAASAEDIEKLMSWPQFAEEDPVTVFARFDQ
jgi:hypothetical protein